MRHPFLQKLANACGRAGSTLCVGIDPDLERIPDSLISEFEPDEAVLRFCSEIIEATAPHTAAFKFNFAFFEALGSPGVRVLEQLIDLVPNEVITIADAKRGDIGNTARMYADAIFGHMGFDACTVSPYMGRDSVDPFLSFPGTCTFVLGRTSNRGASDFQTMLCDGVPLYEVVARSVQRWGAEAVADAGLVVGATDSDALAHLRSICPDMPFLIPGVGAQGGSAAEVARAAGSGPMLVNMSRSILYADTGPRYADAAASAARTASAELTVTN